jgi:2-haloacid dehalogenase
MSGVERGAVRALLFDVFGTVVDWHGSIARETAATFGSRFTGVDWPTFADAWRAEYQPAMERVRSGARGFVTLDVLHRENLDAILPRFGMAELDEAERADLNRVWHRLDPWPDSVAGMLRLKRRFILASQSNGNIALIVNMARRGGLPWDVVLGAEVVRAYKPQPQAYRGAVQALGLDPAQCLMVAAHPKDLEAAAACGLGTAYVHRPVEYGTGRKARRPEPGRFMVEAEDFLDLAAKLGC